MKPPPELSIDAISPSRRDGRPVEEHQKQLDEEFARLQTDLDVPKIDSVARGQIVNAANYLKEA